MFIHPSHIIVATATSSSKSDPHAYLEITCLLIGVMELHTTTTTYQVPYQIPHVAEPVAIVLDDQAPLNAEGDQSICGVPPNASIHVKAVSLSSSRRITDSCCCSCCCLHIKSRPSLYSVLSNIRTGPTDANAFRGHRLTIIPRKHRVHISERNKRTQKSQHTRDNWKIK